MAGIDNIRSSHSMTNTSRSSVKADQAKTESNVTRTSLPNNDAVSLSDQSKAIGQISSQMASSAPIDSAKVAAIKEAISNGSYVVDPDKLADNMIRFENELNEFSS